MKKTLFSCFVMLFALTIQAQSIQPEVVNTTGGWMKNSTHLVEWSLGESVITTITNSQNMLTQGVLQPLLITVGIIDQFNKEEITVYPNPVNGYLHFKTSSTRIASLTVSDLFGREVFSHAFESDLDIKHLPGGIYFLSLLDSKSLIIATVKIIKI